MPKCAICKKHFASFSSLEDHHRSVHKGQKLVLAPDNRRRSIILTAIVVILLLGGVGGYFALHAITTPSPTATTVSNWIGLSAPTFNSSTVNPVGGNFSLAHYRGKSNVLILFNEGLSCSPCLQQMVDMNNNYSQFKTLNVIIVGITADSSSDLSQWANVNGIGSLILISDQKLRIFSEYGMSSSMMSHTFVLIGASGTIRWKQNYPSMFVQENQLISNINSSLA